jgi:DNA-binding LytR/AlgR family response regulator
LTDCSDFNSYGTKIRGGREKEDGMRLLSLLTTEHCPEPSDLEPRETSRRRNPDPWLLSPRAPALAMKRIAIKAGDKVLFVDAGHLIAAEASGNYVSLLHTSGSYLIREPIVRIEEKLSPYGFVRIHRGILVNAAFVKEFMRASGGEYLIRMTSGKEYTVSRTYKGNLRLFAESWLGSTF